MDHHSQEMQDFFWGEKRESSRHKISLEKILKFQNVRKAHCEQLLKKLLNNK